MGRLDQHGIPGSLDQHTPDVKANSVTVQGTDWDSDTDGQIENSVVDALTNFGAGDAFAGYPISPQDDVRTSASITSSDSPYTTSGEDVLLVDTSSGAITVNLGTSDTVARQHVRIIDIGGSIETNAITLQTEGSENLDGGTSSVSIDGPNHTYVDCWSDGTDWFTSLVKKATSVETEKARINDLSVLLEKTSDQSISSNTETTVDWDSQSVDTDLYSYDASADTIDVLEDGDYTVCCVARLEAFNDQNAALWKVFVNGTEERRFTEAASGTVAFVTGSVTLKDLSANDTIRLDVFASGSTATLDGNDKNTFATITRSG